MEEGGSWEYGEMDFNGKKTFWEENNGIGISFMAFNGSKVFVIAVGRFVVKQM
jgi:hypothetical protein